jgi:hypothetical protein
MAVLLVLLLLFPPPPPPPLMRQLALRGGGGGSGLSSGSGSAFSLDGVVGRFGGLARSMPVRALATQGVEVRPQVLQLGLW